MNLKSKYLLILGASLFLAACGSSEHGLNFTLWMPTVVVQRGGEAPINYTVRDSPCHTETVAELVALPPGIFISESHYDGLTVRVLPEVPPGDIHTGLRVSCENFSRTEPILLSVINPT